MLELFLAFSLAVSSCPFSSYSSFIDSFINNNSKNIIALNTDTTSFLDAYEITKDTAYSTTFTNRYDKDYYYYHVTESGYYNIMAICSNSVSYSIYTSTTLTSSPTLYTSYSELSTNSNFGFNNGIYVDASTTSYLYFCLSNLSRTEVSYVFAFQNFERHETPVNEFLKYDVEKKLFSYINYSYTDDNTLETTGYNPNGTTSFSFPSGYSAGDNYTLSSTSSINTTTTYPYSAIAQHYNLSTGYLVGLKAYATAAHCVYNRNSDRISNNVTNQLKFGNNGTSSYSYAYMSYVYFPANYMLNNVPNSNYNPFDDDFAICILDRNIGDDVGYLGITRYTSASQFNNAQFVVDGYKENHAYQTLSCCDYIAIESNDITIEYSNNTCYGDSGAPVFNYSNHSIVATHTGAISGSYSYGSLFTTVRYFITKDIIGGTIL